MSPIATDASCAACLRRWPAGTATVQPMRRWSIATTPRLVLSCLIFWCRTSWELTSRLTRAAIGVRQLPRLPDHLQSHGLRWWEQSRSAGLWELQTCRAQMALHVDESELPFLIICFPLEYSVEIMSVWALWKVCAYLLSLLRPGFSPLPGDGRLHAHPEYSHRSHQDPALLPQSLEPRPGAWVSRPQDLPRGEG